MKMLQLKSNSSQSSSYLEKIEIMQKVLQREVYFVGGESSTLFESNKILNNSV